MSDLSPQKRKPKKKSENILVIRSAARVFNQTLESLQSEFPNSQIVVLASETGREALEADPLVSEVQTIPRKKRMSVFSCGLRNIHYLRSRKFHLAVSLYNVERGLGYSNIDLLAWVVKPKSIRGYNSKGTYVVLTGRAIFEKMFREKTSGIWMIANFCATVILFGLITLGISAEWLFRKLVQNRPETISSDQS